METLTLASTLKVTLKSRTPYGPRGDCLRGDIIVTSRDSSFRHSRVSNYDTKRPIHSTRSLLQLNRNMYRFLTIILLVAICSTSRGEITNLKPQQYAPKPSVRFATFNTSLFRSESGQLTNELKQGSEHARATAAIIHAMNPDVILLNEFDYDGGESAELFLNQYLNTNQFGLKWPYHFTAPVNTGVDSSMDLDGNQETGTPNDAWGFGAHPGQYGMLVISKHPIDVKAVRTFQFFRWSQMPDALQPMNEDGTAYYPADVWSKLRLSSKSHWDVPIVVHGTSVHLLVAHPTPPVFDGPEDRNGKRNHDEIRLLRDYACSEFDGRYIVDDEGKSGALPSGSHFVIAGDLNADPKDGDGLQSMINSLLQSPSVNSTYTPTSLGAKQAAATQGKRNSEHSGDPAHDTGDFNDNSVGNLRADYVIASHSLNVIDSKVYWPAEEEAAGEALKWLEFSDHHPVWIDVLLPSDSTSNPLVERTFPQKSLEHGAQAATPKAIISECKPQADTKMTVVRHETVSSCASSSTNLSRPSSWFNRLQRIRLGSRSLLSR